MTMSLPAGAILLTTLDGPSGVVVRIGERLIGVPARFQHVAVAVGGPLIVEAEPGGARLTDWGQYQGRHTEVRIPRITTTQSAAIARHARTLIGTPYSYLDYASIGLVHGPYRPDWLRDYVADTGHMICSQLADEAYARAGIYLFNDRRPPGDVAPGDMDTTSLTWDCVYANA
jgi:uncharacterized protein YycO